MRSGFTAGLALAALLLWVRADALDPPDHERWQESVAAVRTAVAARDVGAAEEAVAGVFEQAIRMPDRDPRVLESSTVIEPALQMIDALGSRARVIAFLERLNRSTAVRDGLSSVLSWTPANMLSNFYVQRGDDDEAHAVMRDVAERAARDLGDGHLAVRTARRRQAEIAAQMGDFDAALATLAAVRESTRKAFGPASVEVADVIIATAGVHGSRDDVNNALEVADEAYALIQRQPLASMDLLLRLAAVYEDLGRLERARELYQRADVTGEPAFRNLRGPAVPILLRLATVNARLGDGYAARRYLTLATELAESAAADGESALPYVDALFTAASIYGTLGNEARVVESIERGLQIAGPLGGDASRPLWRRAASSYLLAGRYADAARLAEELLRTAVPGTEDYVTTAAIVALAGARLEPPVPRLDLAQAAVDLRRSLASYREPEYELYALAVSYAGVGRWEESLELQRKIIDASIAKRGSYGVSWTQWRTYAWTLEGAGRSAEAAEIRARVHAETQPVVAVLLADSTASSGVLLAERSAFGFTVLLTDRRWRRWSGEITGWPLASFSAQYRSDRALNEATLAVTPVLLPEGVDAEAAIAGLLETLRHDRGLLQPWSNGELQGYEYKFTLTNVPGRPFDYVCRIVIGDRAIYHLAVAADVANRAAVAAGAKALDQVTIGARPDPATFGSADRKHHAFVLNTIGTGLAGRERFNEAFAMYAASRTFDATELLLQNIIFVNLRAGNFDVVRDEINVYPGGPAAYPRLYLVRALSHSRLGNLEAAVADYAAGFAAGEGDDDSATEYVSLLVDAGRAVEAMAFLEEYGGDAPRPAILALQALVGVVLDDRARLEQVLLAIENPQRSSAETALVGGLVHMQLGGLPELAAFVERLSVELVSAELYVLLASAQVEARALADARRSIALGLGLAPDNADLRALEDLLQAVQQPVL